MVTWLDLRDKFIDELTRTFELHLQLELSETSSTN